jgi:K+-sensing histidine kinase KdpD
VSSRLENPAIVTLSFLLVVLVAATMSTRRVAIVMSIGASLCFKFFSRSGRHAPNREDPESGRAGHPAGGEHRRLGALAR